MSDGVKILLLDIETQPAIAYIWSLFDTFVPTDRIVEPGRTLCWAAKWLDKDKVTFRSVHHHGREKMIEDMYNLLEEADVVIHYNGKRFDMPTLNREFLLEGYTPPTTYKEVDLLQVVRKKFRFPSNKLDYVSQELGIGAKVVHKGMDLWKGCMAGVAKDWKVMKKYNIQDVSLLELLYRRLLPWIDNHPNRALWMKDVDKPTCRNCGGTHVQKRGMEVTKVLKYQRYKCVDCGANMRGRVRLEKPADGVLS